MNLSSKVGGGSRTREGCLRHGSHSHTACGSIRWLRVYCAMLLDPFRAWSAAIEGQRPEVIPLTYAIAGIARSPCSREMHRCRRCRDQVRWQMRGRRSQRWWCECRDCIDNVNNQSSVILWPCWVRLPDEAGDDSISTEPWGSCAQLHQSPAFARPALMYEASKQT